METPRPEPALHDPLYRVVRSMMTSEGVRVRRQGILSRHQAASERAAQVALNAEQGLIPQVPDEAEKPL